MCFVMFFLIPYLSYHTGKQIGMLVFLKKRGSSVAEVSLLPGSVLPCSWHKSDIDSFSGRHLPFLPHSDMQ